MSSCSECTETLPNDGDYVVCGVCHRKLHYNKCSGLSEATWRGMSASRKEVWACNACKKTRSRTGSTASNPEIGSTNNPTLEELKTHLNQILDKKMEFLEATLNNLSKQLAENNTNFKNAMIAINELQEVNNALQNKIKTLESENTSLKGEVASIKIETENLNQYSRRNNIEIFGYPEEDNEDNTNVIVKNIGKHLQVVLKEEEFVSHRVGKKKEDSCRPILVKFENTQKRDNFLRKAKGSRLKLSQVSNKLDNSPLYISENMSPYFRKLRYEAKQIKEEKHYKYLWFANGKLLIKKDDNTKSIKLNHTTDLLRL